MGTRFRVRRFYLVTGRLFLRKRRNRYETRNYLRETAAFAARATIGYFKLRSKLEIDFRNRGMVIEFTSDHIVIVTAV